MNFTLCLPALLYFLFSSTQIIIDILIGAYNTAIMKFATMIFFTLMLNILCKMGLGVISWIIVFIPFLFMTFIVGILLYVFGLNSNTGTIYTKQQVITDHEYDKTYDNGSYPYFFSSRSYRYESFM